jgi:hypothetical protein
MINVSNGGKDLIEDGELMLAYGRRYGVIGRNGTGKTTLLRALVNYELKGLPKTCCTWSRKSSATTRLSSRYAHFPRGKKWCPHPPDSAQCCACPRGAHTLSRGKNWCPHPPDISHCCVIVHRVPVGVPGYLLTWPCSWTCQVLHVQQEVAGDNTPVLEVRTLSRVARTLQIALDCAIVGKYSGTC